MVELTWNDPKSDAIEPDALSFCPKRQWLSVLLIPKNCYASGTLPVAQNDNYYYESLLLLFKSISEVSSWSERLSIRLSALRYTRFWDCEMVCAMDWAALIFLSLR